MKIYVAGSMTATRFDQVDTETKFDAFHDADRRLKQSGHVVYNPATNKAGDAEDSSYQPKDQDEWAELEPEDYRRAYREVMERDIRWIMECDAMALLPGWRSSQGALFEHSVAAFLGKRVSNVQEFVDEPVWTLCYDTGPDAEQEDQNLYVTSNGSTGGGIESPHYAGDVGFDLACTTGAYLLPGEFKDLDCNLRVALPDFTWGLITGRSSTFRKHGLLVLQGVIDGGYRGPIRVGVTNTGPSAVQVKAGQELAQLIVLPRVTPPIVRVGLENLPYGSRGHNSFGSTG